MRTISDLRQQTKVKDKTCSEVNRLKGIITAQDEKVCLAISQLVMQLLIVQNFAL